MRHPLAWETRKKYDDPVVCERTQSSNESLGADPAHYDKIGLLKPSIRLENNYRVYSEADLLFWDAPFYGEEPLYIFFHFFTHLQPTLRLLCLTLYKE